MNKNLFLPIILQLAGILVIIAEIIIPSAGILSLMAMGLIGYSLYIVYTGFSSATAALFIAFDIIIIPVLVIIGLKLLARSPVTLRYKLSSDEGVVSQSPELADYVNAEGTAVTNLHPAGVAMIDGKRLDVVSRGDYIDKGSQLVVTEVTANQVIVRQIFAIW
ncbi:MAG: serine protease [Desulfobulbaceae bacterium]|nr:serine protease [Desulfobulbaceae bacterium]